MSQPKPELLTFTVLLTLKARQIAAKFRHQQTDVKKAKQVYLNTLAVWAVDSYLKTLGIETDLEAGHSWDPVHQTLSDTAALAVKGLGMLECRPVLPDERNCWIPPEVWTHRVGYVAVQFDPDLTEAKLLGFTPTVDREIFPLIELQSLAVCLQHLKPPVRLGQWLNNIFDAGWEAANTLLAPPQAEPAFQFRSARSLTDKSADRSPKTIARKKAVDLELAGKPVELFVGLKPSTSREMDISIEIRAQGQQSYLPRDLQLAILDETGIAVMQAQARNSQTLQLEFSGESGERFSVKVSLGGFSLTEAFLI